VSSPPPLPSTTSRAAPPAAEKSTPAAKVADAPRADRTTPVDPALAVSAAQSEGANAEQPAAAPLHAGLASSYSDSAPAAAAAPHPPSSDVEITQLPRTGIQPLLENFGRALRAAQGKLSKLGADSASKLGPSAKKLGASTKKILSTSATKLGESTKNLGTGTSSLARRVSSRVPPASTMRSGAAKLVERLRATLGKVRDAETRPRWFLPAVAIAGLVLGVGLVGILYSAFHKSGDETAAPEEALSARPSASAPAALPTATPTAPPPANTASTSPCTVVGSPHVVAPSAIVAAGVEVVRMGDSVAVGFAPTEKEGMVVALDPSSLTATTTTRARSADPVRRVTPTTSAKGGLTLVVDADKTNDRVQGRRTVLTDPPVQLGAADGNLVWAPLRQAATNQLWPLDSSVPIESLRGAVQGGSDRGFALAFRRGSSIWMGAAEGATAFVPKGDLAHVDGLGSSVGSPSLAIGDGIVLVAWADRASSDEPWRLRWVRFKAGSPPGQAATFVPPAGGKGEQAMSPGLTSVSGGRFLLVWTEGPTSGHDVRALTLSSEGRPLGGPLVVSSEGTNAGQGQAAVNANGQGVIAFLESRGESFEVAATSIACGQ
jgi:hypothetical protein